MFTVTLMRSVDQRFFFIVCIMNLFVGFPCMEIFCFKCKDNFNANLYAPITKVPGVKHPRKAQISTLGKLHREDMEQGLDKCFCIHRYQLKGEQNFIITSELKLKIEHGLQMLNTNAAMFLNDELWEDLIDSVCVRKDVAKKVMSETCIGLLKYSYVQFVHLDFFF
ncbi:hypothetical protein CDL12_25416 [Handroanthus impetiginosus]|uniref:Uncharacterized protein n=1 Tax=Handroanthus impetiginosus TaxID=429701 RepID=A0A2G9GA45_9LAMI|nr:hypothetical protein CDL12_25416 [Handroanthus impetiginosus]